VSVALLQVIEFLRSQTAAGRFTEPPLQQDNMHFRVLTFLFLVSCFLPTALAQNQSDFLSDLAEARKLRQMLPNHVNGLARAALAARAGKIASLTSAAAFQARKQYIRERILASLGSLPERTPLNVRPVGTLERPDYRIEKFIFESQPRFYVPAHLYLPKRGTPPYPAILFPLGHEFDTKARPLWQLFLGTLATRGYVVLTYDPVGQGERIQLYDPDWGESKVFRNNTEHTILGIQCLLIGDNLARYSVWDGMRALDYLVSRPEVDATRIACTGNSGGGNITAFLAALDDRIQVAAPSCWINSWQSLLDTIGQQDAEQVLIPSLQDGLDHGDFIYAFAPRPYLILSAIRDFFAIKGVRETYDEARQIYAMLGVEEKLHKEEADAGHDYLNETAEVCRYIREGGDRNTFLARFRDAVSPGFDPDRDLAHIGLANQTTMLMSESLQVQELLRQAIVDRYGPDETAARFRAFDTICSATQDRQDAVVALLRDQAIDLMLVIGGYNSSNTCNLARICAEKVPTFHIADPECLQSATTIRYRPAGGKIEVEATGWLPPLGNVSVGLTSGASTPDNLVGTAVRRLGSLCNP